MAKETFFVLYDEEKELFLRKCFGYTPDVSKARRFPTYSGAKQAKQFLPKFYLTSSLDVRLVSANA